jgi:uncharacterized RDD family membrane protein YckC
MTEPAQRGIVTPEAVLLEFETAGVGSRAIARIIDAIGQTSILYALVFAVGLSSLGGSVSTTAAVIVFLVGVLGVLFGYPITFQALWNGRTPGKAAMGLRVVTVEGAPIRFRHATVREVVGLVDFFIPPGGATAILSALFTRRTQRLGDLAAGTIVLRERTASQQSAAMVFRPFPGWEPYTASLDVAALTAEDYGVVRSFLIRVGHLDSGARIALAAKLATPIAAKLHHTPPPGVHPEHFLLSVAAAYQHRFGGPEPVAPPAPPAPPPPPASTPGAPPPLTQPRPAPGDFAPPA